MVTQGYTATLVAATWPSADRVCTTGRNREAAGPIGSTTNRSSWRAGKNPRMDIAA